MQKRLVYTDELMAHLTCEYNRRAVGSGLKLAWIEKAVNDTPTAEGYEEKDNERPDDQGR